MDNRRRTVGAGGFGYARLPYLEICLHLSDGHARPPSAEEAQPIHVGPGQQRTVETGERDDDVGRCPWFEADESRWRHAGDGKWLAVEVNVLANDIGIGTKLAPPIA